MQIALLDDDKVLLPLVLRPSFLAASLEGGFVPQHPFFRPRCAEKSQFVLFELVEGAFGQLGVDAVNLVLLFSDDGVRQVGREADAAGKSPEAL